MRAHYIRTNVVVAPCSLLTMISSVLNESMVLVVVRLRTFSCTVRSTVSVMIFPLIVQVPRMVPVTP